MEIDVKIREVYCDDKYCPVYKLYIGKLIVATYGYNYNGSKCSNLNYVAHSNIHFIKRERWTFETMQEAKNFAYKIAETVLKGLQYKEE